jgi:hypothetical protein
MNRWWVAAILAGILMWSAVILVPLFVFAQGSSYYVHPDGNDSQAGTEANPWKTIQHAVNMAQAGDTVLIRGGVYEVPNNGTPIRAVNSGTPDDYITFKAYPGEQPVIQGFYDIYWGFDTGDQAYIIIEGLTIRGFHAGVRMRAPGHHIIVRDCLLEFNSEAGVSNNGGSPTECADYTTVEGCTIRWNGSREGWVPAAGPYEGWGSGITYNADSNPFWFDQATGFHHTIRGNEIYENYDFSHHTDGNGIIMDRWGAGPPVLTPADVLLNRDIG